MTTNDQHAFPTTEQIFDPRTSGVVSYSGMTLRDYFAAAALPTIVHDWCESDPKHYDKVAENAYLLADAMFKARLKESDTNK